MSGIQRRPPHAQPQTPRLVNKQVLVPTEPTELTAFLPTLGFEDTFSPGLKLHSFCVFSSPTLFGICFCLYKGFVLLGTTFLASSQTPLDSGCSY